MRTRSAVLSILSAIALSSVIAGPALAGGPTFTGSVYCTMSGVPDQGISVTSATHKDLAQLKKFWSDTCEKGTWDTSGLIKDA